MDCSNIITRLFKIKGHLTTWTAQCTMIKQTHVLIFLENDDIYVEENKKEASSLIISAGNT